jgi:hypothetical protein
VSQIDRLDRLERTSLNIMAPVYESHKQRLQGLNITPMHQSLEGVEAALSAVICTRAGLTLIILCTNCYNHCHAQLADTQREQEIRVAKS